MTQYDLSGNSLYVFVLTPTILSWTCVVLLEKCFISTVIFPGNEFNTRKLGLSDWVGVGDSFAIDVLAADGGFVAHPAMGISNITDSEITVIVF